MKLLWEQTRKTPPWYETAGKYWYIVKPTWPEEGWTAVQTRARGGQILREQRLGDLHAALVRCQVWDNA